MDDASVTYGGMNQDSFDAMLDRALAENPLARVVVRTHPDVVAGRRKGYLQARAMKLGVEISAEGDNPIPWLKRCSKVYAGTSQLGYEALLCGCEVHVAGLPFYAGWGLTQDYQKIDRRIRTRTLDQLFHATHVHFARYCSPVTGEQWSLQDCIDHVCVQKRYFQMNAQKACMRRYHSLEEKISWRSFFDHLMARSGFREPMMRLWMKHLFAGVTHSLMKGERGSAVKR